MAAPGAPVALAPGVYWPLSAFYGCYFAAAGALLPYLSLYLLSRGFRASAVGELLAAATLTKLVAPYVWGAVADRFDARRAVIRLATVGATASFAGIVLEPGYWGLLACYTAYSFFTNATLPQFEALTLTHLRGRESRYPQVRLWGSVGFIASVAGLGFYLEGGPVDRLPVVVIGLLGVTAVVAAVLPAQGVHEPRPEVPERIVAALRRPPVLAFLAAALLMQASHGAYYGFFTPYLQGHGYAAGTIGLLWALGVVSEIVLFLVMHRVLERYALRTVVLACFGLTALRWGLLAGVPELGVVVVGAQLLHAASYGAFHAVSMILVSRYFPGGLRGRGQAVYASVSFGLGGALGSLCAGYLWDAGGGGVAFVFATGLSLAAGLVAWLRIR